MKTNSFRNLGVAVALIAFSAASHALAQQVKPPIRPERCVVDPGALSGTSAIPVEQREASLHAQRTGDVSGQ